MKKLSRIVKWVLLVWGALSLAAVLVMAGLLAYSLASASRDHADHLDEADVRFVMNWCGLRPERIERLVHSFESNRSFTGDHWDGYAIKVRDLNLVDLKEPASDHDRGWIPGDMVDPVVADAIGLLTGFADAESQTWFPGAEELRSSSYRVYVSRIVIQGRQVDAAEIIFANPETGMLYYGSCSI